MIKVDGKEISIKNYPAGELLIEEIDCNCKRANNKNMFVLELRYENNEELMALYFIVNHLKCFNANVDLIMSYIPYARMDRVKRKQEIFTLKYFANFINSMNFHKVYITDPHSDVSMGLINNIVDTSFIRDNNIKVLTELLKTDLLFYPDNGCAKRLSHLNEPNLIGFKDRDWKTGEIKSLKIIGDVPKDGFDVLIVDDICSKGGTFYYSALELKKIGANKIYLYVTHCENSILDGNFGLENKNLLETGLIKKVFTTDSICSIKHEKIEFLQKEEK